MTVGAARDPARLPRPRGPARGALGVAGVHHHGVTAWRHVRRRYWGCAVRKIEAWEDVLTAMGAADGWLWVAGLTRVTEDQMDAACDPGKDSETRALVAGWRDSLGMPGYLVDDIYDALDMLQVEMINDAAAR